MGTVDFILNLAGLLLWLNWRTVRFDPLAKRLPATLMGTLRSAAPKASPRWQLFAFLAGLLTLRAAVYRWLAPFWIGRLDFGLVSPSFRSDWFGGMLAFSVLSFGLMLGVFYLELICLSLLAGPDPIQKLVKICLGRVDGWSRGVKILLPPAVVAALWWGLSWVLGWLQICPPPVSMAQRIEQSLLIGLGSYLAWKIPLGILLTLHLLNSYIYFGRQPFWKYVSATAQTLLSPLKKLPLRIGKLDLAPVLALVLLFLAAELLSRSLNFLYLRLPF